MSTIDKQHPTLLKYKQYTTTMLHSSNAWKISQFLNSSNDIKEIEYYCSCGSYHKLITYNSSGNSDSKSDDFKSFYTEYSCKQCGNDHFTNHNRFMDKKSAIYVDDFKIEFDYQYTQGIYTITAHTLLLDSEEKKLVKRDLARFLFDTSLNYTNQREPSFRFLHSDLMKKMIFDFSLTSNLYSHIYRLCTQEMVSYIKECNEYINRVISHISPKDEKASYTLLKISFFYNNSHITEEKTWFYRDIVRLLPINIHLSTINDIVHQMLLVRDENSNIIYTHPKSVKKVLFKNSATIQQDAPIFDYIILSTFRDPNYVVRLLSFPSAHKELYVEYSTVERTVAVLQFLKNVYSEKQLYNLFKESIATREAFDHFKDSWSMIERILDRENYLLAEDVRDEVCTTLNIRRVNITTVHERLIYISNYIVKKDTIKNDPFLIDAYLPMEVEVEHLHFRVAKAPQDLSYWGDLLHNCLSGYSNAMYSNKSIIFGVFSATELLYAIEIKYHEIKQALGKYNRAIGEKDKMIIYQWFDEYYIY